MIKDRRLAKKYKIPMIIIDIGERAGSGVPDILNVWEDEGYEPPEIIEEFVPDRTKLVLSFEKRKKQAIKTNDNFKDDGRNAVDSSKKRDKKSIETRTDTNTKTDTNTNIKNETEGKLLKLIQRCPESTLEDMMNDTGLSKSGVRYVLNKLRERGVVTREGTRKNGRWVIR